MKKHSFNFNGGDILSKIGASWFASYWNFTNKNPKETSWKNCLTVALRIKKYQNSNKYHKLWKDEIAKMDEKRLSKNKLGLTGTQVKNLLK